ncbi:phosphocarrier protein HPr [endosymbiont of Euscepes postfasciatus]|uniref:HPr family phosphocarrier protein n=1 Tax=endosymbiont of Euscepes postfasciatus TaxID=650377 RepID=UPI000DC71BA8|nr:HPr family phosphocarrier protein [endosymbiont of Euscepes postfasciatus]BBA84624.1 phosphocarrier protein HPr [endosymbiont of Euscepes postfasciatus]
MYIKNIKINIKQGFHIRPLVKIVNFCKNFNLNLYILKYNYFANGKNLFELQKLKIINNDIITIVIYNKYKIETIYLLEKLLESINKEN